MAQDMSMIGQLGLGVKISDKRMGRHDCAPILISDQSRCGYDFGEDQLMQPDIL
jgi:hypothetical protein